MSADNLNPCKIDEIGFNSNITFEYIVENIETNGEIAPSVTMFLKVTCSRHAYQPSRFNRESHDLKGVTPPPRS